MAEHISSFMTHPLVLCFMFLSSVGGFIMFCCGVKDRGKKRLAFTQKYINLFTEYGKKIPGLHLSYKSKSIDDLVVSNCIVWNCCSKTIVKDDVATPLTIKTDGKILSAAIIFCNHPTNDIKIVGQKRNKIEFTFLNRNNGCVIQVFHTGKVNSLVLECEIIDGEKVKYVPSEYSNLLEQSDWKNNFFSGSLIVGMICMMIVCFFNAYNLSTYLFVNSGNGEDIVALILAFVSSFCYCLAFALLGNKRFDLNIPKDLRKKACKMGW